MEQPYPEGTEDPFGLADALNPLGAAEDSTDTFGLVYFIGPAAEIGPVKIGFTERLPRLRLGMIQTGNPLRLAIHVLIPAAAKHERFLHRAFADDRMHGEWFRPSYRIQSAIRILRTRARELFVLEPGQKRQPGTPLMRLVKMVRGPQAQPREV